MTVHEILGVDSTFSELDSKAIAAIEADLTEKNDKPYIKCRVRGKNVSAKLEEIVRQLWIYKLEHHCHYPLSRITKYVT
ncbi:MAG TPA: hypothetical protein VFB72_04890 [Verrucomicrobiae bacterium]|nr:hypothetical protein [Verrucomicrobiae bacterium]